MKGVWKFIFAGTVLLALAGTAGGLVLAQSGDDTATPPATEESAGEGAAVAKGPNFVARLAEQLGITEEELRTAVMDTELQIVDEWLATGRIDEEQAARLRERIEAGNGNLSPFGHRLHKGYAMGEELAQFLGITVEELREARQDEQSLAQIAEANGVSRDELIAFLVGQFEEKLNEKVADGAIDQARADEALASFRERIDELVDRTEPVRPHRPFRDGRFGGPGGFFDETDDTSATDASVVF